MEKQLTIAVRNAAGEEGLNQACRRGELFRNDSQLEKLYSQGYRVHDYSIVEAREGAPEPQTLVRVVLKK
jgi:hypothetical protein